MLKHSERIYKLDLTLCRMHFQSMLTCSAITIQMTRMIVFVPELRRPIKENEENDFDYKQSEVRDIEDVF